jgi:DNA invertase Pin-like site-specific DNA recombinase
VIYVRVSSSRQVQHQVIEQQLARVHVHLRAPATWALRDEHVYRDDGYTGAALARPGLDRLRDAVKGERMRRGRSSKRRAGLLLPWTRPPYGDRLAPDRPRDPRGVTVDPAEGAIVAELLARYLEPEWTCPG